MDKKLFRIAKKIAKNTIELYLLDSKIYEIKASNIEYDVCKYIGEWNMDFRNQLEDWINEELLKMSYNEAMK